MSDRVLFLPVRKYRSCLPCARSKRSCDHKSPCGRCVSLGIDSQCIIGEDRRRKVQVGENTPEKHAVQRASQGAKGSSDEFDKNSPQGTEERRQRATRASKRIAATTTPQSAVSSDYSPYSSELPESKYEQGHPMKDNRPPNFYTNPEDFSNLTFPSAIMIYDMYMKNMERQSEILGAIPAFGDKSLLLSFCNALELMDRDFVQSYLFRKAVDLGTDAWPPEWPEGNSSTNFGKGRNSSSKCTPASQLLFDESASDVLCDTALRICFSASPIPNYRIIFYPPTLKELQVGAPLRAQEISFNKAWTRMTEWSEPEIVKETIEKIWTYQAQEGAAAHKANMERQTVEAAKGDACGRSAGEPIAEQMEPGISTVFNLGTMMHHYTSTSNLHSVVNANAAANATATASDTMPRIHAAPTGRKRGRPRVYPSATAPGTYGTPSASQVAAASSTTPTPSSSASPSFATTPTPAPPPPKREKRYTDSLPFHHAKVLYNPRENCYRLCFKPDAPLESYPWYRYTRVHQEDRFKLFDIVARAITLRLPTVAYTLRFNIRGEWKLMESCLYFDYSPIGVVRAINAFMCPILSTGRSPLSGLTPQDYSLRISTTMADNNDQYEGFSKIEIAASEALSSLTEAEPAPAYALHIALPPKSDSSLASRSSGSLASTSSEFLVGQARLSGSTPETAPGFDLNADGDTGSRDDLDSSVSESKSRLSRHPFQSFYEPQTHSNTPTARNVHHDADEAVLVSAAAAAASSGGHANASMPPHLLQAIRHIYNPVDEEGKQSAAAASEMTASGKHIGLPAKSYPSDDVVSGRNRAEKSKSSEYYYNHSEHMAPRRGGKGAFSGLSFETISIVRPSHSHPQSMSHADVTMQIQPHHEADTRPYKPVHPSPRFAVDAHESASQFSRESANTHSNANLPAHIQTHVQVHTHVHRHNQVNTHSSSQNAASNTFKCEALPQLQTTLPPMRTIVANVTPTYDQGHNQACNHFSQSDKAEATLAPIYSPPLHSHFRGSPPSSLNHHPYVQVQQPQQAPPDSQQRSSVDAPAGGIAPYHYQGSVGPVQRTADRALVDIGVEQASLSPMSFLYAQGRIDSYDAEIDDMFFVRADNSPDRELFSSTYNAHAPPSLQPATSFTPPLHLNISSEPNHHSLHISPTAAQSIRDTSAFSPMPSNGPYTTEV